MSFDEWNPLQRFEQPTLSTLNFDDNSESEDDDNISITSSIMMLDQLEQEMERSRTRSFNSKFGCPSDKDDIDRPNSRQGKGPQIHYGLGNVKCVAKLIWNNTDRFSQKEFVKANKFIKDTWLKRNISGVIPPNSPSRTNRGKPILKKCEMRSTRLFSPYYATPKDEIIFHIEANRNIFKPILVVHPKLKQNGYKVPSCSVVCVDKERKIWKGNLQCKLLKEGKIVFELRYKSQTSEEIIVTETTDGNYVTIGNEEVFKPMGNTKVNLSPGQKDIVSCYKYDKWKKKRQKINYVDTNKKWVLSLSKKKGAEFSEEWSEPMLYKVLRALNID